MGDGRMATKKKTTKKAVAGKQKSQGFQLAGEVVGILLIALGLIMACLLYTSRYWNSNRRALSAARPIGEGRYCHDGFDCGACHRSADGGKPGERSFFQREEHFRALLIWKSQRCV